MSKDEFSARTQHISNEQLATTVHEKLESRYTDIEIGALCEYAQTIELDVQSSVTDEVLEHFSSLHGFADLGPTRFRAREHIYDVRVGLRLQTPALDVWVLDSTVPSDKSVQESIEVSGIGYVTSVDIFLPRHLDAILASLAEHVAIV